MLGERDLRLHLAGVGIEHVAEASRTTLDRLAADEVADLAHRHLLGAAAGARRARPVAWMERPPLRSRHPGPACVPKRRPGLRSRAQARAPSGLHSCLWYRPVARIERPLLRSRHPGPACDVTRPSAAPMRT